MTVDVKYHGSVAPPLSLKGCVSYLNRLRYNRKGNACVYWIYKISLSHRLCHWIFNYLKNYKVAQLIQQCRSLVHETLAAFLTVPGTEMHAVKSSGGSGIRRWISSLAIKNPADSRVNRHIYHNILPSVFKNILQALSSRDSFTFELGYAVEGFSRSGRASQAEGTVVYWYNDAWLVPEIVTKFTWWLLVENSLWKIDWDIDWLKEESLYFQVGLAFKIWGLGFKGGFWVS